MLRLPGRSIISWLLLPALLTGAPGCDNGGGQTVPELSGLYLWPQSAAVNDGGGSVSVSFTIDVADAGADVNGLTVVVLDGTGLELSRMTAQLENPSGSTAGTIGGSVNIFTGTAQTFMLTFQASDAAGSSSNVVQQPFQVVTGAPVPRITALDPSTVEEGSQGFTMTVTGSDFAATSVVAFNGYSLATTFVDAGTLLATVPSYVLPYGPASIQVSVYTSPPGGGVSGSLTFNVVAPLPRPVPVLSSISPAAADAGGPPLTLTLSGSGFVPSSMVSWNGFYSLSTTYLDGSTLQATVPSANLGSVGTAKVTVVNPAPGGGTSTARNFDVRLPPQPGLSVVTLQANDVAWDPYRQKLYLSVPSSSAVNPNTVTVLDPFTGLLGDSRFAGSEPGSLALSDDGQFLYVGLLGASEVNRFSLPGLTLDLAIPLGRDLSSGAYLAKKLGVAPGAPHTLAASMVAGYSGATAVFDDATVRANKAGLTTALCWGDSAGVLYTTGSYWGDLTVHAASGSGLAVARTYTSAFSNGVQLEFDPGTGLLYGSDGRAVDPATGLLAGTFSVGSNGAVVAPDSSLGSAFFTQFPGYGEWLTLRSFDLGYYTPERTTVFSYLPGPASRMIRWGPDGLALLTATGVVLVTGTAVLPVSTTSNPVPAITSLAPATATAGGGNLRVNVIGTGFVPGSVVRWKGVDRSTRRLGPTELVAYLPASDLTSTGIASITVSNPLPGGGISPAATFTVDP